MSKPITKESFEMDDYCGALNIQRANQEGSGWNIDRFVSKLIDFLEDMRQEYIRLKDDEEAQYQVWKELVRWLPESWLQTRTVTMNYENLLAMCSKSQRRPHKLNEWSGKRNPDLENFVKWARTLPYAQEFIFFDELETPQTSFNNAKDKMFIAIDKLLDSNAAQEFKIAFNKLTHTFGYQGVM